jgi:hypothetical protein
VLLKTKDARRNVHFLLEIFEKTPIATEKDGVALGVS